MPPMPSELSKRSRVFNLTAVDAGMAKKAAARAEHYRADTLALGARHP
jgi:hypothetical protein